MTDAIALSEEGFTMPAIEVLTGRGFVTGKSGSGKSNTVGVIAEELLEADLPVMILDTDGEYYALKETYEVLHLGGDDHCDLQVTPDHAEAIAAVALDRQVPTVLDLSGFRDPDAEHELVGAVVEALFRREKTARTPFLLIVEEAHEFMPERGGLDDLGETFVRVAKRGRKRGLGICALSQRPAAVSKDYITQCDWLVWHRLTWENDTDVVARILGRDTADEVTDLDDGEAVVMTDWDDAVQRVQFRRKRTFDAGATPELDDVDRPEFESVDADLIAELADAEDESDLSSNASGPPADGIAEKLPGPTDEESGSEPAGDPADDQSAARASAQTAGSTAAQSDGGSAEDDDSGPASDRAAGNRTDGPTPAGEHGPGAPDPADDPAWEVAQLVTYVGSELATALRRGAATTPTAGSRTLERTADAGTDALDGRSEDPERVWTILVRIGLVLFGVVLGFGLASLF